MHPLPWALVQYAHIFTSVWLLAGKIVFFLMLILVYWISFTSVGTLLTVLWAWWMLMFLFFFLVLCELFLIPILSYAGSCVFLIILMRFVFWPRPRWREGLLESGIVDTAWKLLLEAPGCTSKNLRILIWTPDRCLYQHWWWCDLCSAAQHQPLQWNLPSRDCGSWRISERQDVFLYRSPCIGLFSLWLLEHLTINESWAGFCFCFISCWNLVWPQRRNLFW